MSPAQHRSLALAAALAVAASCATPKAAQRPAVTSPSAPSAAAHPIDPSACGPAIANLDAIRSTPLVLLGELHGLTGPTTFAIDLACRLAIGGQPVLLALEIPRQEQERIDAFLASPGAPTDRAALIEGSFWHRPFQDGRSSEARVALLDTARRLRAQGLALRVAAIDDTAAEPSSRDQVMAESLLAARRTGETAILLIGNLHVRTQPGAPWNPAIRWSGVYLREKEPALVALDNRYAPGEAWVCPSPAPESCGIRTVKGEGTADGFSITRFERTDDKGLDGTFNIGPAVASRPALQAP
ncbi:MAG TPA: hypothetical protein VH877_13210 [Polyangia bacterium]|jgi:hypothetical protein|nr:hypothetical protein [Polyangia bacterium]